MRPEKLRPFRTNGAVTERRPFRGAGDDPDVTRHGSYLRGRRAGFAAGYGIHNAGEGRAFLLEP